MGRARICPPSFRSGDRSEKEESRNITGPKGMGASRAAAASPGAEGPEYRIRMCARSAREKNGRYQATALQADKKRESGQTCFEAADKVAAHLFHSGQTKDI